MKPGLRKVAALILASATLFGSGASVSAAYADDTTVDRPTRIQAEPDVKTTTGGDEAATKPDTGSGDEAGTGADEQSGTGAPAQSAPQADAGQAAPDVTIHDMLDTDSAAVSRLRLADRITGTAPFDRDNGPGDDKDENNDIVRSYDTVTYDYEYTLTPDSTMDYYRRTRVGMLFEDHNTVDPANTTFGRNFTSSVSLPARILDTARIGTVTPIVAETAYWTRKTLARTANLNADAPDTQWQQWSDSLATRLPEYANSVKPDLTYSGDTYRPATFDDNGVYQGGDTADTMKGDSLYIAGETPHIAKQVEQTNEAGNTKTVYDLDKEQRTVDWKLTATADTSTTTDGGQYTTDYIITDTLPKGLAYVDGSMTVGGQYTQHTPDKGTVTGGTPVTPTLAKNEDGTTTMTIRVNGARADSNTQTVIHYSTTIGDASDPDHDVRNNDSFTNHASIRSKRNMAPPLSSKAQTADMTVRVSRTRASSLATRADPLLNDVNRPLGYTNMLGNFSKDEKTDPYAVDVMPYLGDGSASRYSGDYVMTGLNLGVRNGASLDNAHVYFTTDPKWRTIDATKITREQVERWTEARLDRRTGKVTIPDGHDRPVRDPRHGHRHRNPTRVHQLLHSTARQDRRVHAHRGVGRVHALGSGIDGRVLRP